MLAGVLQHQMIKCLRAKLGSCLKTASSGSPNSLQTCVRSHVPACWASLQGQEDVEKKQVKRKKAVKREHETSPKDKKKEEEKEAKKKKSQEVESQMTKSKGEETKEKLKDQVRQIVG